MEIVIYVAAERLVSKLHKQHFKISLSLSLYIYVCIYIYIYIYIYTHIHTYTHINNPLKRWASQSRSVVSYFL